MPSTLSPIWSAASRPEQRGLAAIALSSNSNAPSAIANDGVEMQSCRPLSESANGKPLVPRYSLTLRLFLWRDSTWPACPLDDVTALPPAAGLQQKGSE